jgi:hypothetical protein
MNNKWLIFFGIILVVAIGGGFYAYREFMRKPKDALETKAAYTLSPAEISKSFMDDEQKANKMYVGKAIAIRGIISEIKTDENGNRTLVFYDSTLNVTISASLDSIHNPKAAVLQGGDKVSVKGFCVGFNRDELLGSDIQFNRCGITEKK